MKCIHCVNKATEVGRYGRNLCDFHYKEALHACDKQFEAWCVVGAMVASAVIILIVMLIR